MLIDGYDPSTSGGNNTIWYWLEYTVNTYNENTGKYGAGTNGCNDWFIPSKLELDMLRESGLVNWFTSNYIWSSVEYYSSGSWSWYIFIMGNGWANGNKDNAYDVVAVRAF